MLQGQIFPRNGGKLNIQFLMLFHFQLLSLLRIGRCGYRAAFEIMGEKTIFVFFYIQIGALTYCVILRYNDATKGIKIGAN